MRIDILAIGSRGDVQPYLALGIGLRNAGFQVRMVTIGGFEELVAKSRLEHLRIGPSHAEITHSAAGREWAAKRSNAIGFLRGLVKVAAPLIEAGLAAYWDAGRHPDALIVSPMGFPIAMNIAERLRAPVIQAQLVPPVVLTRYGDDGELTLGTMLRGALKISVQLCFHFLLWTQLRDAINTARRRVLDLPELPLFGSGVTRRPTILGGYSPAVAPPLPDWGDSIHVTGYWFLDDADRWTPPDELRDFLDSGPPPVFVGFGSNPFPNPEAATKAVVRAIQKVGRRAILLSGGSGLGVGRLSDEVLAMDAAPHSWLFPRVSAAVHHGGAGVTGAALREGLPSVVVPVFADQPYWGGRVFRIGAGPRPIPAAQLNEENLAAALRVTEDPEIRRGAARIGERIRREDGVARAVEVLHREISAGAISGVHAFAG